VQDRRNRGPEARLFGVPDWVRMGRRDAQGRAPGHSRAPYPPEECPVTIRWGRAINRTTLAGSRQPIIVNLDVSGDNARAQSVLLLFFLHPPSSIFQHLTPKANIYHHIYFCRTVYTCLLRFKNFHCSSTVSVRKPYYTTYLY